MMIDIAQCPIRRTVAGRNDAPPPKTALPSTINDVAEVTLVFMISFR